MSQTDEAVVCQNCVP